MSLDPATITVFLFAVGLLGISKGGLTGLGLMSMPMLLLVMPPAAAAGLMLPILMMQDALSVWIYRGRWDNANLKLLLPAATLGIAVGFFLFWALPPEPLLAILGAVTLAFAVRGLARRKAPAETPPRAVGLALGIISGFTSTILHQGGPPFQMYLLPQKLSRDAFAATSVAFFAVVNAVKLPGFIALGQVTRDGLIVALVAAPFSLTMTWLGARLVRIISPERFFLIIYVLLAAVGVKLLSDAFL
ncbi:MAG: sulfite exporter TauE/SafE family protein [Pseudomonadota bacterium]